MSARAQSNPRGGCARRMATLPDAWDRDAVDRLVKRTCGMHLRHHGSLYLLHTLHWDPDHPLVVVLELHGVNSGRPDRLTVLWRDADKLEWVERRPFGELTDGGAGRPSVRAAARVPRAGL